MGFGDASPAALLDALAAGPASQLGPALIAAQADLPGALHAQRDAMVERLPELPTPTGIAVQETPHAVPKAVEVPAATQFMPPKAQGPEPSAQPELVLEAPAAAPEPTRLSAAETADGELAASAQRALASVQLPTEAIPDAAPPPLVQLSGEADPQRMLDAQGEATSAVSESSAHALRLSAQDFGEQGIGPAPDSDLLSASSLPSAPPALSLSFPELRALPPALTTALDVHASPPLYVRLQDPIAQTLASEQQLHVDAHAAQDQAGADISRVESEAVAAQLAARQDASVEVGVARGEWQTGIERIQVDALSQGEAERDKQTRAIAAEKLGADAKARAHIEDADRQAAAKEDEAKRQAAAETAKAEGESDGFLGWAQDKARAFIDGLKATVNAIYDGLRAAVKALFEAATRLASGVIELAQRAIVQLIQLHAEALKRILDVALAAFPELAERIRARIDAAVAQATELVQGAADLLKAGVVGALDLLADTLDALLAFAQDGYDAAFSLIGMVVSGEWAEIMEGLENLISAAGQAPPQFEAAAYEELLGGDLTQALSPVELEMAGLAPSGAVGAQVGPPWTPENVGVDPVVTGLQLSPELSEQLMAQTGGEGALEFGWSEDPSRNMHAILGLDAPQGARSEVAPDDGLSVRERAAARWTIMKQSVSDWWSANWPTVLGGGVLGVAGFLAANLLTGGAVMAALPPILSVLGPLFMGVMAAQVGGHVADYLTKGWAGDAQGGGKSLAKALAVGAVELASLLTFKAGGAALKGAKAVARGAARGARGAMKGASQLARKGADYVIARGKVLLEGVGGRGFAKGFKSIDELGQGLQNKTKFKGYRIRLERRRFVLEGKINPWVKIAEGQVVEVEGREAGARFMEDAEFEDFKAWAHDDHLRYGGRNVQKKGRQWMREDRQAWAKRLKGAKCSTHGGKHLKARTAEDAATLSGTGRQHAQYLPEVDNAALELEALRKGTVVRGNPADPGDTVHVVHDFGREIGYANGEPTTWIRAELTSGSVFHGHPRSPADVARALKNAQAGW